MNFTGRQIIKRAGNNIHDCELSLTLARCHSIWQVVIIVMIFVSRLSSNRQHRLPATKAGFYESK